MLVPKTLNEGFGLAKIQEEYLLSCKKGVKGVVDNGRPSIMGLPKSEGKVEPRIKLPLQRLTSSQMEERRKLRLCYNCDEKWQSGHWCKGAKLFLSEELSLEVEQKPHTVQLVEIVDNGMVIEQHEKQEESSCVAKINLCALCGNPSSTTMKVKGRINNHDVVSLLDSFSTHNFIDATILPILKLPLDSSQLLDVKVTDGNVIKTLGVYYAMILLMQGHRSTIDFNVLHLGGCEVVLRTQWLCTLGIIN